MGFSKKPKVVKSKYQVRKMKIIIFAVLVQPSIAASCPPGILTQTCCSKDGFGRSTRNKMTLTVNSDCTQEMCEVFTTSRSSSPEICRDIVNVRPGNEGWYINQMPPCVNSRKCRN